MVKRQKSLTLKINWLLLGMLDWSKAVCHEGAFSRAQQERPPPRQGRPEDTAMTRADGHFLQGE